MVTGFRLLSLDADHIYTGRNDIYSYMPGVGLFLLFLAFAMFFTSSAILSRRLRPPSVLLTGLVVLALAVLTWKTLLPYLNVHYWTFTLVAIPVTMFLCGFLFFIVGAVRWIKSSPSS
jgi:hypothetical protein